MKVVSIVGARPQFIKCAPVSRELRKTAQEVLVHTGQHYDENMSGVFFNQLDIPEPDYNLEVGSGRHGAQTGEMLRKIEEVLLTERPDRVLIYGDTNSTLAGALAAAKLHIPVAHVEAGLRSFNRRMPEEINRVVADKLSALLFCPSNTAVENLRREGISTGVHLVGDVMYDSLLYNAKIAAGQSTALTDLGVEKNAFALATVHRAENTDDPARLKAIMSALGRIAAAQMPVVVPLHPRTRKILGDAPAQRNLRLIEPVAYLDLLLLAQEAHLVLTDSGGLQKEAAWLGTPCVTLREETEWVETVAAGWNTLAGADADRITAAAQGAQPGPKKFTAYGDGRAAGKIVEFLSS